ncbi:MAG: hypothetical protein GVY32_05695 [Gammaproteobacteria bacterium]|jgi:hypothetical protein|nr:hypothetical protein [Gammaproteobacteria bacterium]
MSGFDEAFHRLRAILIAASDGLERVVDSESELSLNTPHRMKNGQPLWFGGVRIGKAYVSYHLMPVYVNPALLEDISDGLRRRMQGKSCFNFARVDETLFEELAGLTRAGRADFAERGYLEAD